MGVADILQGVQDLSRDPLSLRAFLAYVIACVTGQLGNAVWLWLGKEIDCVVDRFRSDPRSTIKSCLANIGVIIGIAVLMPWAGVPIKAAIIMGLLQGAYSDSKINRSARTVWTAAEREAKGATP